MLPAGKDWGREPETDWGYLNAEREGIHFQGKYETLPGDYRIFYNNINTVVRESRDLLVTANEANLVIKVIEAAVESSRSGNRVPLTG